MIIWPRNRSLIRYRMIQLSFQLSMKPFCTSNLTDPARTRRWPAARSDHSSSKNFRTKPAGRCATVWVPFWITLYGARFCRKKGLDSNRVVELVVPGGNCVEPLEQQQLWSSCKAPQSAFQLSHIIGQSENVFLSTNSQSDFRVAFQSSITQRCFGSHK